MRSYLLALGCLLAPALAHAQCAANFNYQVGAIPPAPLSCTVPGPASGPSTVSFTASQSWITVTPPSVNVDAGQNVTVSISVNPAGMPQGSYNGQVWASSGPFIPVALTISSPSAGTALGISASPSALTFSNSVGGGWPPLQNIQIAGNPSGLPFSVAVSTSDGGNWLWTNASVGTAPAIVGVGVTGDTMPPGTYVGTVTVTSPGSSNPPQVVAVTLSVSTTVAFAYQVGSQIPAPKCFALSGTNSVKPTTSGEPWLSVNLGAATACLAVNPAGLAPGNYSSTVQFPPSTLSLQVVFTVIPSTTLSSDLSELLFRYQPGWTPQFTVHVASQNPGAGVNFTASASASSGGNWLSVSASNAVTPATLTVSANIDGMAAGSYTGQITLAAIGGGIPPQTIAVSLSIPQFTTSATPKAVSFTYEIGLSLPATQNIAIATADTTGAPAALPFTLQADQPWINATASGSGAATVAVDPSNLAKGNYSGHVVVTAPGATNSPMMVPVTLAVLAPTIVVQPAQVFVDYPGGAAPPAPQTIQIASASGQPLQFSASSATAPETGWLTVSTTQGGINASVLADHLPQGIFHGTITVTSPNAANSPLTIPVIARVRPRPPLLLRPTSLSFTYDSLYNGPLMKNIAVWGGNTDFIVNTNIDTGQGWMVVWTDQNTTPATITVSVSPQALLPGTYTGEITIQKAVDAELIQTIPVTLVVGVPPAPAISPASVVFVTEAGSASVSQEVGVTYTGDFSTTPGANWLSTSTSTGSAGTVNVEAGGYDPTTVRFKVIADTTGLAPGTYDTTLTLAPADPSSPSATLPVRLVVRPGNLTIPQIVDGGGWKTSILLVNAGSAPAPFTLKFWQPDGTPLALALDGAGNVTEYSDTIPAGGSRTVPTQGTASAVTQGWAEVLTSKAISGSAVIREQVAGAPDLATAVPIRAPLDSRFLVPLEDDSGGLATALAVVNPSAQPATATIVLRDETGKSIDTKTLSLNARQRVAFTIQDQFPAAVGLRGIAEITSGSAQLAAAGLRMRLSASMSAIEPVIPRAAPSGTDVCPIVQIGDSASAMTKLLLVNSGSAPASFSLAFRAADGTLLPMPINGVGTVTEYADTIPVGGMRVIATPGTSSSPVQGWAELATSGAINGTAVFVQQASSGAGQETAAAFAPWLGRSFLVPFDTTQGSKTSLALAGDLPDQAPGTLYADARDENGVPLASAGQPLNARQSLTFSLTDWLAAAAGHRGVLELSGTQMGGVGFWSSQSASVAAIGAIKK